jgi:hypothetical protein
VTESYDHIIHVYGRPTEGRAVRLDHELQAGELFEWGGRRMRVVSARSEDRDYGRVRIVQLESLSEN